MGYRGLVKREVLWWTAVAFGSRLPIAMAPLALLFLARGTGKGDAFGASLAACYIVGEVLGAILQGMWLSRNRLRRQLSVGIMAGSLGFAGLAALPTAPPAVLIALAVVAGAGPAASTGGLRSMLTNMVDPTEASRALSAEAILSSIIWAVAPAAAVGLALQVNPVVPLALSAACGFVAAILIFLLKAPPPAQRTHESPWRAVAAGWPIYLTSSAAMALIAIAELVLPALLESHGVAVGWSGPILMTFAAASAVGAFVYGLRTWPGGVREHSMVLLVLMAGAAALIAVLPGLWVGVAFAVAGILEAGVIVSRNLALRERLPEELHAAAYSVSYAAAGVGYGLTALMSAAILTRAAPSVAILGGVAITLVLTALSWLAERAPRKTPDRALAASDR
ncbi:MFS transporter [Nocardia panacis]|uniref:MFS transporter n=1 Tax=Nocardia panacis TaxID=2340916 RepID=A0A3A4KYV4_9NOCA|nr:MFS transporter [Nocardia panacis]RJO79144.1 MFS transporter [Nocardia panacis]